MKPESLFVVLAVASALIVPLTTNSPAINGVAKAFVGVFVIAFFIMKFFHEPKAS